MRFWHKIIPPALLSMITTAFYYPSLRYPFQFDDIANITKEFDIRFYNALGNWWNNRRWMGKWLNRINFEWGRFDPYYYRLTNLIIHILAGILIFFLILEGCAYLKKSKFLSKHALAIATTTAALFLLHPVQTQAISYVIQARLEGLVTLFVAITFFLFLKAFRSKNIFIKYPLAAMTVGAGFISCGSKEIFVVTPLLLILFDWFFVAEQEWSSIKSRIWFHATFSIVIFATFVHYLSAKTISEIATFKMATGNNRGNILTQNAQDLIKPASFLISSFKVILHYLYIFIWPLGLSVEYDWKLSESFFAPDSFFPFILLASIFLLAVNSLIKRKFSFFGFGIMWFFISVAPRSTIIPSPELICDYKTYLPSVGWLFVISVALVYLASYLLKKINTIDTRAKNSHLPQAALGLLISFPLGYCTMQRNVVWSNPVEFWKDIVDKAPLKARGHNNLGVALSEEKKYDEAIPCYLEAIRLDRYYSDPWSNLSVAYSINDEIEKAIAALRQAIRIHPNYPEAYNNLGTLMIKKENYDAAEKILKIAIQLRPHYGKAYFNLARLYMNKGDMEKAWEHFKKSTEVDLDTIEGFMVLGQMSIQTKKFTQAALAFKKSLELLKDKNDPRKEKILFGMANSLFMDGKLDKAQEYFRQLTQISPNNHKYLYNYGETLFSTQQYAQATKIFEKLTQPPFRLLQANFRYASCLEKTDKIKQATNALKRIVDAKSLPDNVKDIAKREIGRLNLQTKINSGNCTITMNELKDAFQGNKDQKEN